MVLLIENISEHVDVAMTISFRCIALTAALTETVYKPRQAGNNKLQVFLWFKNYIIILVSLVAWKISIFINNNLKVITLKICWIHLAPQLVMFICLFFCFIIFR